MPLPETRGSLQTAGQGERRGPLHEAAMWPAQRPRPSTFSGSIFWLWRQKGKNDI